MRRFRNNKPNYVISILSQDISEILLKCPKCYITILTGDRDGRHVKIPEMSYLILKNYKYNSKFILDGTHP